MRLTLTVRISPAAKAPVRRPQTMIRQSKEEALKASLKAEFLKLADEVTVSDDAVTFQDASGDTSVTIQKNPQKVVNLYASFTTLWYEAGGTVVAASAALLLRNCTKNTLAEISLRIEA